MPNSDLSTDAYAEDEALDDIVVRPEDSASQRQLLVDPELLSPPMGGSAMTNVTSVVMPSFSTVSVGFSRKRTSWVWQAENGEEYTGVDGKLRWRCRRCMSSPSTICLLLTLA